MNVLNANRIVIIALWIYASIAKKDFNYMITTASYVVLIHTLIFPLMIVSIVMKAVPHAMVLVL